MSSVCGAFRSGRLFLFPLHLTLILTSGLLVLPRSFACHDIPPFPVRLPSTQGPVHTPFSSCFILCLSYFSFFCSPRLRSDLAFTLNGLGPGSGPLSVAKKKKCPLPDACAPYPGSHRNKFTRLFQQTHSTKKADRAPPLEHRWFVFDHKPACCTPSVFPSILPCIGPVVVLLAVHVSRPASRSHFWLSSSPPSAIPTPPCALLREILHPKMITTLFFLARGPRLFWTLLAFSWPLVAPLQHRPSYVVCMVLVSSSA